MYFKDDGEPAVAVPLVAEITLISTIPVLSYMITSALSVPAPEKVGIPSYCTMKRRVGAIPSVQ